MENLFKIKRHLLVFTVFIFVTQYAISQQDFFIYKVKGEPYIEVNDSIKTVTKGSILSSNTFLNMNSDDVVHFIDDKGGMYELLNTGTYSYSDLQKIPAIKDNTSFTRKVYSYVWKEFTNNMPTRSNKSGVVYRGDDEILMSYPADSVSVFGGEIRFGWQPKKNKENGYYFMLRDVETGSIITMGTPATSLSLMVDDNLLKTGKQYEWTITETRFPNLKETLFYQFRLLTEDEFKAKQGDIKRINSFLKQLGYNKAEIRETRCQDFKICY